jgi:hypothetical protein
LSVDAKPVTRNRLPIVVAVFALIILGLVALVGLLSSDNRLTWSNGVPENQFVHDLTPASGPVCVGGQVVPRGTGVAEFLTGTYGSPGPETKLTITDDNGEVVVRSNLRGFANDERPRFKFAAVDRDLVGATTCLSVSGGRLAIAGVGGAGASANQQLTIDGEPRDEDIHVQYREAEPTTLASKLGVIARRASLFRPGWVGEWTFFLLIPLALLAIGIPIWLIVARDAGTVSPRVWGLVVALAGFVLAFAWSIVTPAFHPPDEAAHYSYVDSLVQRDHRPYRDPKAPGGSYTDRTNLAVNFIASGYVGNKAARLPWTQAAEDDWARQDSGITNANGGGWTSVANYSPLYYTPAVLPYSLAGESTWTRLWLVRLFSALLFAGVCALTFLTARELLPDPPWIAPLAGICAAFLPMGSHIGGAVNNDNAMILAAAATMYILARGFARGFDAKAGALAGILTALTFIAKPTGIALLPAALVAVAGLTIQRTDRSSGWPRRLRPAAAFGAGLLATSFVFMIALGWGQGSVEAAGTNSSGGAATLTGLLSYIWQWYLPPLPSMGDLFVGAPPVLTVFLRGFIAHFNHLDVTFDPWVSCVSVGAHDQRSISGSCQRCSLSQLSCRQHW